MYTIGITGGTGAGKSSALRVLEELGALALDCDEIYHELLSGNNELVAEIEARFSDVSADGRIDRNKLAEVVWNDHVSLQELNRITHKYVRNELKKRISAFAAQGGKIAAVDAIALIESGQSDNCDITVGIIAPQELRTSRIIDRDAISKEHAQKRIDAQKPEGFFIENCDYILENVYNKQSEFEEKCTEFFNNILQKEGIQL